MTILIVDNSRTTRTNQRRLLAQLGHNGVVEAADGVEALEQITFHQPDLVLVDWNMPHMDGVSLVRRIRESDDDLPIIMCVTDDEKPRVVDAIRAGVNNYIVKPFTADALGERITDTMSKAPVATTSNL